MAFRDVHGRSPNTYTVRDPATHRRQVRGMFARISGVYDAMNHLLSLNLDRRWRRNLVSRLDGDVWEVLDLCAGTGDLALACAASGKGRLRLAADFCPEMLQQAAGKHGADRLQLAAADAEQLPFADGSFDAITVGFGVRNFADVTRGVDEMARVLRPGGQLLVLDFFRDDPDGTGAQRGAARAVRGIVDRAVPLAGRLFSRDSAAYGYLSRSMGEFLTPAGFAQLLAARRYEQIFVARQTLGIAHIVGARRPQ